MSGIELRPQFAAELASNVYLVKDKFGRKGCNHKYKGIFEIQEDSMLDGTTGGSVLKRSHVMAFVSVGKGDYKGQAFVAIKGTASLYDVLTDLNAGIRNSHTGFPIHQGFYSAFDSIKEELTKFINELRDVSVVHCVGHSLGVALATLAADWIKSSSSLTVKLYSFGSPRVGFQNFASNCTSKLTAENIYRAYHRTDPVAMVPTWPFTHVPSAKQGYLIDSPVAIKPWEYHLMKNYIHSAKNAGTWAKMATNRPPGQLDSAVERWLKSDGVFSFTTNSLELLDSALLYVIKKAIHLTGIVFVSAASGTLTLLDHMAMFMAKAAEITTEVSVWVYHLIKKMAALVGVVVKEGANLTVTFIRYVFLSFHQKISQMIWRIGQEII